MSEKKQMVRIPLELLKRLHLSHYHTLSHDEALAVRASNAMDAALVDIYELMAEAIPESDPNKPYAQMLDAIGDQFKNENEQLRKDAERYRFIRDDISLGKVDLCITKKTWGMTASDLVLSMTDADDQIDAAISSIKKTGD